MVQPLDGRCNPPGVCAARSCTQAPGFSQCAGCAGVARSDHVDLAVGVQERIIEKLWRSCRVAIVGMPQMPAGARGCEAKPRTLEDPIEKVESQILQVQPQLATNVGRAGGRVRMEVEECSKNERQRGRAGVSAELGI